MTLRRSEDVYQSRFQSSRKTANRVHSKSKKIRKETRPTVETKLIPRDSAGVDVEDIKDSKIDFNQLIEEFVQEGPDHMGSDWQDFHLQESSKRDKEINQRFQVLKRLAPYPLLPPTSIEEVLHSVLFILSGFQQEDDIPNPLSIENHELVLYDLDPSKIPSLEAMFIRLT